jgi:tRNA-specific 2-thiouridylase
LMLRKAVDARKDQSYVLYVMPAAQLERTLFPIGGMTKDQTRALARELGLVTADKPESQEICFVPYKGYQDYIELKAPELVREGPILDVSGRYVGTHRGIAFHTIGQRRGLGIAAGSPLYVVDLIPDTNTVVVGSQDDLLRGDCQVDELNWIAFDSPPEMLRVRAKIRYRADAAPAIVRPEGSGVRVEFESPQRAITPGQSVVFYDGDWVLGGGTIV